MALHCLLIALLAITAFNAASAAKYLPSAASPGADMRRELLAAKVRTQRSITSCRTNAVHQTCKATHHAWLPFACLAIAKVPDILKDAAGNLGGIINFFTDSDLSSGSLGFNRAVGRSS